MEPKWLEWAKRLQAIAQSGLEYSKDKFDLERFQQVRDISVEILEEYTETSQEKIRDLFCNEKGYQTPKVDVRAVIFAKEKILLVKESMDGCWSMPGGWAEFNLSIKENVVKEVKEEAGLEVEPVRLIAVIDGTRETKTSYPYGIYKAFVLCEIIGGKFEENIETEESGFFSINELPELSKWRNTKEQVEMCFKSYLENDKFTIFD